MKNSNRRSGWDIMRGANGAASHHYATLSIIAYAFLVAERGLFPQKTIEANLTSTHVQFSEIIDPTQPLCGCNAIIRQDSFFAVTATGAAPR